MRSTIRMTALALAACASLPAWSANPRTAVLEVQNMSCAVCPITVRKSLEQVPGVAEVRIDFAKKTATVAFDADKASVGALTRATTHAGFPSAVRK